MASGQVCALEGLNLGMERERKVLRMGRCVIGWYLRGKRVLLTRLRRA